MVDYLMNADGWIGVGLGLVMFLLGYWKGVDNTMLRVVPEAIASTLETLVQDGYVKTRKSLDENGQWQEEIMRYDEEV